MVFYLVLIRETNEYCVVDESKIGNADGKLRRSKNFDNLPFYFVKQENGSFMEGKVVASNQSESELALKMLELRGLSVEVVESEAEKDDFVNFDTQLNQPFGANEIETQNQEDGVMDLVLEVKNLKKRMEEREEQFKNLLETDKFIYIGNNPEWRILSFDVGAALNMSKDCSDFFRNLLDLSWPCKELYNRNVLGRGVKNKAPVDSLRLNAYIDYAITTWKEKRDPNGTVKLRGDGLSRYLFRYKRRVDAFLSNSGVTLEEIENKPFNFIKIRACNAKSKSK